VGDICKIKAGMNVPVDGVILKASGVQANEAAMTGESDELKKDTMEHCKAR
jgi:P-type E1-E2 ATPase